MSFTETMEQHIDKLNVMTKKLEAIETKVPFEIKVMVFFLSLLDRYKFFVTSLKSWIYETDMGGCYNQIIQWGTHEKKERWCS
jgi:hypothetical protein